MTDQHALGGILERNEEYRLNPTLMIGEYDRLDLILDDGDREKSVSLPTWKHFMERHTDLVYKFLVDKEPDGGAVTVWALCHGFGCLEGVGRCLCPDQVLSGSPCLTLLGDVHGKIIQYYNLIRDSPWPTLQLGDMGFDYTLLDEVDADKHRFVPGNHDNYDRLPPHALPDPYGIYDLGGVEFFYIRGAYSPDQQRRVQGVSWWPQEELAYEEGLKAVACYCRHKPQIVLSHDGPGEVVRGMVHPYRPTRTSQIMDAMLDNHWPLLWIFGHHHQDQTFVLRSTTFRCLDELSSVTVGYSKGGRPIMTNHQEYKSVLEET